MARKGNEDVYPQTNPYREEERKFDTRFRDHSKQHKITVKATGQVFYGLVSKVDYYNKEFYLLENDKPGMLGKDGIKFSWNDCTVFAEHDRVGEYTDNMLLEWDSWDRKSGVETR